LVSEYQMCPIINCLFKQETSEGKWKKRIWLDVDAESDMDTNLDMVTNSVSDMKRNWF